MTVLSNAKNIVYDIVKNYNTVIQMVKDGQLLKVDEFEILSFLGEGKYGRVFEVKDNKGERYALKFCCPEPQHHQDMVDYYNYYCKEIANGRKITNKNVVKTITGGVEKETRLIYCIMELVKNAINLDDYIKTNVAGSLCPDIIPIFNKKAAIIKQILNGLKAIHEKNIIHRDIKPANILISGMHVYISDFGVSRDSSQSKETTLWGGAAVYTAPEILNIASNSFELNFRTDIFSLGAVLFEILTETTLFRNKEEVKGRNIDSIYDYGKAAELKAKLLGLDSALPSKLDNIVLNCLKKDTKSRYDSVNHIERDFELFIVSYYEQALVLQGKETELSVDSNHFKPIKQEAKNITRVQPDASKPNELGAKTTQKIHLNELENKNIPRSPIPIKISDADVKAILADFKETTITAGSDNLSPIHEPEKNNEGILDNSSQGAEPPLENAKVKSLEIEDIITSISNKSNNLDVKSQRSHLIENAPIIEKVSTISVDFNINDPLQEQARDNDKRHLEESSSIVDSRSKKQTSGALKKKPLVKKRELEYEEPINDKQGSWKQFALLIGGLFSLILILSMIYFINLYSTNAQSTEEESRATPTETNSSFHQATPTIISSILVPSPTAQVITSATPRQEVVEATPVFPENKFICIPIGTINKQKQNEKARLCIWPSIISRDEWRNSCNKKQLDLRSADNVEVSLDAAKEFSQICSDDKHQYRLLTFAELEWLYKKEIIERSLSIEITSEACDEARFYVINSNALPSCLDKSTTIANFRIAYELK